MISANTRTLYKFLHPFVRSARQPQHTNNRGHSASLSMEPLPSNPHTSAGILPPADCRGMLVLDRARFSRNVRIPTLNLGEIPIHSVLPHLKPMLFKMERLKPMQTDALDGQRRRILLHPNAVRTLDDLPEKVRQLGIVAGQLEWHDQPIVYENWRADEVLRAVLPEALESLTSFSRIGHILHVNLRDHQLPYRKLIGEVLRDKVANCRTVVNKSQTIDNTYRNFQLELLCGEADYRAEVKENATVFEFDFAKVYWNPRLATEHERLIRMLRPADVFYDVFAGVGPFSIPIAKKRCTVLANDLNPESHKWLQHNAKRNKVVGAVTIFNKDGRAFIREDLRADLLQRWRTGGGSVVAAHVAMNLPASALEFLDAFRGLVTPAEWLETSGGERMLPTVHAYCFAVDADVARAEAERCLGARFGANLDGVHFVRNVSPNKNMFRVSFALTKELLTTRDGLVEVVSESDRRLTKTAEKEEMEISAATVSGVKRANDVDDEIENSEPTCKKKM